MAQSSTYFRIDEDVLLEFIYHDQSNPTAYDIEVDDNGSEIKVLDTVDGDSSAKRHLIHELGGDVVNFDVTYSAGYLAIEGFAARKLLLQVGKSYKFDLSALPDPTKFVITGNLGICTYSPTTQVCTFVPSGIGTVAYEYNDTAVLLKGGVINVSEKANPLFATPDEDTGNDINQLRGRFHAVKTPEDATKWALLGYDSTGAYDKFNYINNSSGWTGGNEADLIASQSAAYTAINFIRYDKIRLHLRSGYNFAARGYEGFLFQVLADRTGGIQNNLTQLVYLNQSNYEISNPKPFVLGETLFAKFIEIKVPTVIGNQNPEFNDFFYGDGTGGSSNLDPTSNYGIRFTLIDRISTESGFDYIHLGEENAFTIAREDEFQDFTVVVEDAEDGDYFKIYGERDGSASAFEAYILNRINTSSDDIVVLYEVETYEQVGLNQIKTFDTTFTQAEDFDTPILYRPVIQNANVAVNFSIDVTMRIYNETDNTQIVKKASLTVNQAPKYGKFLGGVNISGSNTITEVFNTLPNLSGNRSIRDAIAATIPRTTKNVKTFIERYNVVAVANPAEGSMTDLGDLNAVDDRYFDSPNFLTSDELEIGIYPMTTYFKFKIAKKKGDDFEMLDFTSVKNMTLNFVDGSVRKKFYHIPNKDIDMSAGEILFRVDEGNAAEVRGMTARKFYIGLDNGSEETAVIKGNFTVE
jgi:hypothetical protein